MKNRIFKSAVVLLLSLVMVSATSPAKKQTLYGKWKMVSGKTNGLPNPAITQDRTWEFLKDNSFKGIIFVNDMPQPYNEGVFMLPNDTTMVTIHVDRNGNLSKVAYAYNYTVIGDTLHLYGFYMQNVKDKPGLLQPMYIDEKWVKIK
jgi:hypothetical protein